MDPISFLGKLADVEEGYHAISIRLVMATKKMISLDLDLTNGN